MLQTGGFILDKWSSNHPTLNEIFTEQQVCNVSQKYLGLEWDMEKDCIQFNLDLDIDELKELTKRSILSFICQIYDPLGFISPFILYGKIIFQHIWLLGPKQGWDNPLPSNIKDKFNKWICPVLI